MSALNQAERSLATLGPRKPLAEIVVTLNLWYHEYEAQAYDGRHPEIFDSLPDVWQTMTALAVERLGSRPLRVLDFGCGTGFATGVVLSSLKDQVREVVCHDLSPAMLERCRARFSTEPRVRTAATVSELARDGEHFDLLVTNSLLHHLPSPVEVFEPLTSCLARDAVWITGHEPSRRFLLNPVCQQLLDEYRASQRWQRFLSPSRIVRRLARASGFHPSPAARTAERAWSSGLFDQRPTPQAISELVDLHVPVSSEQALTGRGFDPTDVGNSWPRGWNRLWLTTYNFMGPHPETGLSRHWRDRCADLQRQFPLDGANFCAVWQRGGASE
ncbi:MAG: methyltransferase domain-containing protein [Planctomycetaceae bacterium]|nr:methyltransferase domain-containing protein [Planctomycetaceae bacterium]